MRKINPATFNAVKFPVKVWQCRIRPTNLHLKRINAVITNITLPYSENLTTLAGLLKKHVEEKVLEEQDILFLKE